MRFTDFGLAKEKMGSGRIILTFCGIPEYLAPEIVENMGYGKDVDWWSLGILLYEMLVGVFFFYHDNVQCLYNMIRSEPVSMPSDYISPLSRSFLEAILQRDATMRLGYGVEDVEVIKSHPFFKLINWTAMIAKKV